MDCIAILTLIQISIFIKSSLWVLGGKPPWKTGWSRKNPELLRSSLSTALFVVVKYVDYIKVKVISITTDHVCFKCMQVSGLSKSGVFFVLFSFPPPWAGEQPTLFHQFILLLFPSHHQSFHFLGLKTSPKASYIKPWVWRFNVTQRELLTLRCSIPLPSCVCYTICI